MRATGRNRDQVLWHGRDGRPPVGAVRLQKVAAAVTLIVRFNQTGAKTARLSLQNTAMRRQFFFFGYFWFYLSPRRSS